MSLKSTMQEAIKDAMRSKDTLRLEALRMAKGALLLKEKESAKDQELSDADAAGALRAEVRKRRQSIEMYREHNRPEEVTKLEAEIAVIEEFLPKQLSEADVEERVIAYITAHPEVNHAGKLTGAMKKELGDTVDGKLLAEVCKRVLESGV